MRIESVHIKGFGRLTDLEVSHLDHPLIVITGTNEAGKSTFFEFLKTMLFGIYPTSAAKHRYVPWSGQVLDGSLSLKLSDGATQTVSRRLRSTPEGQLLNGSDRILRNQTLPAAAHISRDLFDAFYAVRLDDLAAVHGRCWEEVQQRLLSELSPESMKPVAGVLRELEEDANRLWRPDRRGKPEVRRLHQRLKEVRERALEARRRDAEARRSGEQADRLEQQLEELQQRRLKVRTRLKQLEALRPLAELERRRRQLQELVGDPRVLSDLPEDARTRRANLGRRRHELEEDLQAAAEQLERLRPLARSLDGADETLLGNAPQIEDWARRLEEADRVSGDGEVEAARDSFRTQLEDVLGDCPPGGDEIWVRLEGTLAEALHALDEAERTHGRLQARTRPAALSTFPPAVVALSAVSWAALASMAGDPAWPAWLLGTAAAGVTVFRTMRMLRLCRQARHSERAAHRNIEALVRESGLGSEVSVAGLAEGFAALSASRRALAATRRSRQAGLSSRETLRARCRGWLSELNRTVGGVAQASEEPLLELAALRRRLDEIEIRRRRAELLAPQVQQLETRCRRLQGQLTDCEDRRRRLEERLAGIDPDLSIALDQLERRQAARRQLEECERLLAGRSRDADDDEDSRDGSPGRIAALEEELEQINRTTRHGSAQAASLRTRLEHLAEQPSASDLEGEIASLREEIEQLRFRRDRLTLLSSIVKEAQRNFRRQHQPDVLRRASRFLSTITGDRYRRLDFNREGERLEVYNGAVDALPVQEPLSQGTRDQIYLALRLAVIDHLDSSQEALPLFLDEILVNWDRSRRFLGYRVLEEVTRRRQVFVFTCHEWLAAELESEAGARRVELTPAHQLAVPS